MSDSRQPTGATRPNPIDGELADLRHRVPVTPIQRATEVRRQAVKAALVLVALVAFGTVGYMVVERWSFRDAFFMTMTTLTTVGYGEVRPLSFRGELFTVVLLAGGVGAALYTLNAIMRLAMEGELQGALGEGRMRRRVAQLRDHVILCGFGRVGEEIARTLAERNERLVVVDRERDALTRAETAGLDHVHGDATLDEVLRQAGIERARCLIAALGSDAANSWVVLSARALNPKLWIVARADQPESEGKLRQAGADRVVSPPSLGGRHLALAAVQPLVLDFTQSLVRAQGIDLMLAQLTVADGSQLCDGPLGHALAGYDSVTVLGIRRTSGELLVKPDDSLGVRAGDELIILGSPEDLAAISGRATVRTEV